MQTYIDHYEPLLADFSDRQLCMLINNNNHLRSQIEDIPSMLTADLSEAAQPASMSIAAAPARMRVNSFMQTPFLRTKRPPLHCIMV